MCFVVTFIKLSYTFYKKTSVNVSQDDHACTTLYYKCRFDFSREEYMPVLFTREITSLSSKRHESFASRVTIAYQIAE